MRACLLVVLLFGACRLSAQHWGDPDFYLLDSLDLETVNERDRQVIDSLLVTYHTASSDTAKALALVNIGEGCVDSKVWPLYNEMAYKFIEQKFTEKLDDAEHREMMRYYSSVTIWIGIEMTPVLWLFISKHLKFRKTTIFAMSL